MPAKVEFEKRQKTIGIFYLEAVLDLSLFCDMSPDDATACIPDCIINAAF